MISAFDVICFKDELDAAMNIVKSHAEIRGILKEFESDKATKLFGNGSVSVAISAGDATVDYDGVGKDGTAMLMNIEMNKEAPVSRKGKASGGKPATGKKKKVSATKGAAKNK